MPMPSTPVSELMQEESTSPTAKPENRLLDPELPKLKSLKSAKSVENLRPPVEDRRGNTIRKASTDSSNSLPSVAVASSRHDRPDSTPPTQDRPLHPMRCDSMGIYETTSPKSIRSEPNPNSLNVPSPSGRRSAPPVPSPVKRRKPPAIPTHRSMGLNAANGGGKNMATIGPTITSSPLSQNF